MALSEDNNGRRPSRAPLASSFMPFFKASLLTLGSIAVTMLGLLFITFIIGRVMPIDPVLAIVGERASQSTYDAVYQQLGLDKPLLVQFAYYLWDVLHLDFGTSLLNARPVSEDIARVFPATLELATLGIFFGVILGVPLGVLAAVRKGSWIDQIARVVALVGYSMPIFWLGLMGLLVFYGILGWVGGPGRVGIFYVDIIPTVTGMILIDSILDGNWDVFWNALKHLVLPATMLGWAVLGIISRMIRASMLDVMNQDYITTAKATGSAPLRIVIRDAFRTALVHGLTIIGVFFAYLITGAILTETIFSWPGIGKWMVDSIFRRDYPVVQGGLLLIAVMVMIVNLTVDVLYGIINPKIRKR